MMCYISADLRVFGLRLALFSVADLPFALKILIFQAQAMLVLAAFSLEIRYIFWKKSMFSAAALWIQELLIRVELHVKRCKDKYSCFSAKCCK